MTENQECQELLMSEVIRIDLVKRTWALPVPFQVQNVSSMTVTDYSSDDVLLSLDYVGEGDATMKPYPKHEAPPSREMMGQVYAHSLQVPIDRGFQAIREKAETLRQTEFHVVLHTYGGTRFLAYSLPNTSTFNAVPTEGQYSQLTVKVALKSMSGFIRLAFATEETE